MAILSKIRRLKTRLDSLNNCWILHPIMPIFMTNSKGERNENCE